MPSRVHFKAEYTNMYTIMIATDSYVQAYENKEQYIYKSL